MLSFVSLQVALAAQTLSSSVADGLEFASELGYPDLRQVGATALFVRVFDQLFDVLNSRTPAATGYKAPVTRNNLPDIECLFRDSETFIMSLEIDDRPIVQTNKKTGFLGFIFCMRSLFLLSKELLFRFESPFAYVLSYKMSQDHLELLFNSIRGSLGWNDNPTAKELVFIFRRLLARVGIQGDSSGNCLNFSEEDDDLVPTEIFEEDSIYLSAFVQNIVPYIAGFVVRKLLRHDRCPECRVALITSAHDPSFMLEDRFFLRLKNKGGLLLPSSNVIRVLRLVESLFRSSPIRKCTPHFLFVQLLRSLPADIFNTPHMLQEDHRIRILRSLVEAYAAIRCFHVARVAQMSKTLKRPRLTKYVHFLSQ